MNNLKKIIARNFVLSFLFVLFLFCVLLLPAGMGKIDAHCFLDRFGTIVLIILIFVGLAGFIISILPPNRRPSKILFYSFFFLLVIVVVLFSKSFKKCKQENFSSKVGVICEDAPKTNIDKINIGKNNKEGLAIWKKCMHPSGFSFEYPDYLKITKEEKENNYWQITMESADFSYQNSEHYSKIASGFELSITANPVTNTTFDEFRNWVDPKDPSRNRSGIVWVEKNSRKFFIQIFVMENIFDYSLNTLYNPNLMISAQIIGTKNNKEEMRAILNHFMETLE